MIRGMNLLELMRALGHSEMRTTFSYIEKLKEANYVSRSNVDKVISEAASSKVMERKPVLSINNMQAKKFKVEFPSKFVRRACN